MIKNLKDAEKFLEFVKEIDRYGYIFENKQILDANCEYAATRISYDETDGEFYDFNSGRNWTDQEAQVIDNPVQWVYTHRAGINSMEY